MSKQISPNKTTESCEVGKTTVDSNRLRLFLSFHYRAEVKVIEVDDDGDLYVVGREPPATINFDDPTLSRQHARFQRKGDSIYVHDLDSRNGIFLGGKRVQEAVVHAGDNLSLGHVTVAVFRVGLQHFGEGNIVPYESLRDRLNVEIARCRQFGRSFALIMVRLLSTTNGNASLFWNKIIRFLRSVDTVSPYGSFSILVTLPETSQSEAHQWCSELIRNHTDVGSLVCGVTVYPTDGANADELIALAHSICRLADKINPIRLAETNPQDDESNNTDMVVQSFEMRWIQTLIHRVADLPIPILIQGETGTGKEVVARSIHMKGIRKDKPFLPINCATIPETLIESTLFGHERGAFTDAHKASQGVFEKAGDGIVFLDEIGELSASAQAALLRVVEEKRLTRVGGSSEIAVSARIIAATHCDLEEMVNRNAFREDLFYRLNTIVLRLPPLKERAEEIPHLIELFIKQISNAWRRPELSIDPDAFSALVRYDWPGNIRQLRNTIERSAAVCLHDTIQPADLPKNIVNFVSNSLASEQLDATGAQDISGASFRERLRIYEIRLIKEALYLSGGNRKQAAAILQLPLRTFSYKLTQYGIQD